MRCVRTLRAIVARRSRQPPRVVEPREVTPGLLEARAARRESTDLLRAAIDRGHEVRDVAARVEEHARQNHFMELFTVTLNRGTQ